MKDYKIYENIVGKGQGGLRLDSVKGVKHFVFKNCSELQILKEYLLDSNVTFTFHNCSKIRLDNYKNESLSFTITKYLRFNAKEFSMVGMFRGSVNVRDVNSLLLKMVDSDFTIHRPTNLMVIGKDSLLNVNDFKKNENIIETIDKGNLFVELNEC